MKQNKNHLLCSCTICHQELIVQSLEQHIDIKHVGRVRIQDKHSKYREFTTLPTTQLIETYQTIGSILGTLKHFNINNDSRCRDHLIKILGNKKKPRYTNYVKRTDLEQKIEEIKMAAITCTSISSVLQTIGVVHHNSALSKNLRNILQTHNITLASSHKWTPSLIYCEHSKFSRSGLAPKVKRDNWMPYICAECNNAGAWNTKQLKLQIDHKNGINTDHRKENLRWLCPNCHSQTDTFCRMKTKS